MNGTYYVFKRSAVSFESFARAKKTTLARGLTYEEAQRYCARWNADRTPAQIRKGTKAEFTQS